jgi:uncharacterized protein YjbI with pentapeptide repeats
MKNFKASTHMLKAISALIILLTGFGGFATQAAQAIEQSCDIDNSLTLIGCDFQGLDLSGRALSNRVIVNSNFSGANLQSADLQGVNLTSNTFSSNTTLAYANLSQANLSGLDLSGVNLTGATLNNSNMSGANLTGVNLTNANLTDANFSSANLTNAVLSGTNISNTDFSKATFVGLAGRNLSNSPMLLPDNWKIINGYLVGPKANLANANLSGQPLSNLDLSGADLSNANLASSNLTNAKLVGAKLNNANLTWADLSNTDFTGADLTGVDLSAAYVSGTNFTRAILINIKRECLDYWACGYYFYDGQQWNSTRYRVGFQEATLTGVRTSGFPSSVTFQGPYYYYWYYCYYYGWRYCGSVTNSIPLPSGWSNRNGVLLGKGVDLSGRSFNGWDFSNLDLSNVSFENTQLTGTSFAGSTLVNVDFSGKDLRNVNFGSANLTGANFSGAILDNVNFNNSTLTGANFDDTNLSSASFSNVTSGQITGTVTGLPSGWKLINGYLVGRTARLYGADLSGADLSGMDLTSTYLALANLSSSNLSGTKLYAADLWSANLSGANLSGVSSGGIGSGPSSLPGSWHFIRGYLVGPKANLDGVDFSNLDLSYWDFSGANLSHARLVDSTFRGTNFVGATLAGANFSYSFLGDADFTDADLSSSSFNMSTFENTNFTRAKLLSVSRVCHDYWACYYDTEHRYGFARTVLTGVKTQGLNISFSNYNFSMPSGWTFRNGMFFGPTADLSGLSLRQVDLSNLNLSSANLSGVDLSSANLSGTDLSNAVLSGVKSRAVVGTPSLPAGWILANGVLIGAGVDAVNVNISGLNLEGLNLAGIDLSNSNLSGANLRNVDLSGANLRNANLSGADISGSNLNLTDLAGVVFGDVIAQDIVGSPLNVPNGWALQDGKFIGTIFLNPVSISGKLELEQLLTANVSSSPVNVDYVFTWYRDGVAIENSNSRTYQIGIADLGTSLSVRVSASKTNFLSASVTSGEVYVSNTLPELQNLSFQGSAVKDGQLAISFDGKVGFSTITYQVSRDGGRSWSDLAGPNYNIRFNDLGGNLNFRIVQTALGYVSQTTNLEPIAVDGSYILPGFALGSIDGANSGFEVEGNTLVGSSLKATKSIWSTGTKVTGFWWSSKGSSVGTKLIYKSTANDIGAQLMYVEVGVSPEGATRYRLSSPLTVTPNQFDNSSQPTLIGSSALGSKLKFKIGPSWSSRAKYTYQWLSDGEVIPGSVGTSYTITADDIGSAISVRVCASKPTFADKCEDSSSSDVITYAEITISTKPSVKLSSIKLGRQLSAYAGRWQAGVTLRYEWLRDGNVIAYENKNTYLLTSSDKGHFISIRVTGSKPGYYDLSQTSDGKDYK